MGLCYNDDEKVLAKEEELAQLGSAILNIVYLDSSGGQGKPSTDGLGLDSYTQFEKKARSTADLPCLETHYMAGINPAPDSRGRPSHLRSASYDRCCFFPTSASDYQ